MIRTFLPNQLQITMGFSRIWEDWADKSLLRAPRQCQVLIWGLKRAKRFERPETFGRRIVWLQPGEFVFAREEAAKELGMKPEALYKAIKKLERRGIFSLRGYRYFTVGKVARYNDRASVKGHRVQEMGEGVQPEKSRGYRSKGGKTNKKRDVPRPNQDRGIQDAEKEGCLHLEESRLLRREDLPKDLEQRIVGSHPKTGEPVDKDGNVVW